MKKKITKPTTVSDVPDTVVYLYANLYNQLVEPVYCNPAVLKVPNEISKATWYKDMLSVIRLMDLLKCSPRDYFSFQIREYKPTFYRARKIPTLRMLTSPVYVNKWEDYQLKKTEYHTPTTVSKKELLECSRQRMQLLMDKYKLSELAFFQDPVCLSQVSPDFLRSSKTFKTLFYSGYYKTTYGLEDSYILN